MSFVHRSIRRRQAEVYGPLILVGWVVSGCTTLLDIDDEYALETSAGGAETGGFSASGSGGGINNFGGGKTESGGARDVDGGNGGTVSTGTGGVPAANGGFGGEPATGGVPPIPPPETGGIAGTGSAAGTGGTGGTVDVPDAGGAECTTGKFTGTFEGMHAPSITFVGVPLPVDGAVNFQLVPSGTPRKLKVAEALFNGEFNIIRGAPGVPFTATMVGDYDCDTRQLTGELVKGSFSDPEAPQTFIGFSGAYSATYTPTYRLFTGTWNEAENTSTTVQYKGDGKFSARRVLQ